MALKVPIITTGNSPVITVLPPSISVGLPTITYSQFINSLGTYNYGASFFYMHASGLKAFQQINQAFNYTRFDSNGDLVKTNLIFTVDPYQQLPATFYDSDEEDVVFNGFSSLLFTLLANTTVHFKMQALISYVTEGLNQFGDGNQAQVAESLDIQFNDDYCDYL